MLLHDANVVVNGPRGEGGEGGQRNERDDDERGHVRFLDELHVREYLLAEEVPQEHVDAGPPRLAERAGNEELLPAQF